jgi:FG-GAP repeat/Tetratricopeptide repeat
MQTRLTGPTHDVRLLLLCVGATLLVPLNAAPSPQTTPSANAPAAQPGLAEGFAKLQAGDAAGAVAIVEPIAAREPKNARAWRVLGLAYIRTKQYDKALAAYATALDLEPENGTALYNTAVVHALQGQKDAAFEWLARAKATGKVDMTQIDGDNDLVSLKGDARFSALLPTREEFAKPFVEPVKIIREWDGEAAGDQFGWIARNIGDVDGDHIPDVVTSAPTKDVGGANAGRIYVYSTRTGKLLWTADGHPGDQLGTGVEGAGDTNGDGVPDVVAGAPYGGKAYVYSGKDGHILLTLTAENKADQFGQHISAAGDVDHDGYADVIVGAPGNGAGGEGAGRAYVYSGKDGHLLLTLTGERPGDRFGSTVGGHGDKKQTFLIVGAPGAGPNKHGRTYVYDGLSGKPKFVIDSDDTGNALGGMFVSVVGDVDGDKVPDIYASDWSNGAKGPSTGRIYVHSGKDGRRLLTLTGQTAGEGFGIGPATAGDVDHDGHADLIIGSWQYAGAAPSGGRASLYSGKDGHLMKSYTGKVPGETFGFDAVGMGDVDGDGTIDFLITSAWSDIHGFHSGRMFIISSGVK